MDEDTELLAAVTTPAARRGKGRERAPTALDELRVEEVREVVIQRPKPGSKGLEPGMRRYTIVIPEEMVERVKGEVAANWGLKTMEAWEGLIRLGLEAYESGRRPPMEDVPAAVRKLQR